MDNFNVDTPGGLKLSVAWMQMHVARIHQGGRWIIPRSGSVVVIDHANKQAIRVLGLLPETSTEKVFQAMGWTWIDKATG